MKYIEVRTSHKKSLAVLGVLALSIVAPITATTPAARAAGERNGNNRDVTLSGTVVDSQNQTNVVRFQDSSGNYYTAETVEAERFRVGQTIQASGRLRGSVIRNATVTRIYGWGGNGGHNNNSNATISGTVVDSGNQVNVVRILESGGRIYTAQTSSAERFRVGESVEAKGYLRGSTLSNATVRRTGGGGWNGGGNNNQNVTVVGTVIDSQNQTDVVRLQENGGRIYTAQTGRAEHFNLGDTVEAKGYLRGNNITNATVRRLRGGNGGGNGGGNSGGRNGRIDFSGVVVDSGNQADVLRVRADDGTTYTVSTSSANRYRVNDRVRVSGSYDGSVVSGAQINRN